MKLLEEYKCASFRLKNHVVMAPMTRCRAIGGVPGELVVKYYTQRATAGLIISEGIAPCADALGYARIPGIFSQEQVDAWRRVTAGVHGAGGRIFAQLMHTGRVSHPNNQPEGARIVAPSAVRASGEMYTDLAGPQGFPVPQEMTGRDIQAARESYVQAARNAIAAGFDGVELHAANGYLLEQFLHPHTNHRSDGYGGSASARARFVVETTQAVAAEVGHERVGIRLSPHSTFNDMPERQNVAQEYVKLVASLGELAYLHVVESVDAEFAATLDALRAAWTGTLVLNGGYDSARAEQSLVSGRADLVSFGRPFIANPDFVARTRVGATLAEGDPETYYSPGPEGYVDYLIASEAIA